MSDIGLSSSGSITPLPVEVHQALPVVAAMGIVSFVTTVVLFLRLSWMLLRWKKDGQGPVNQFVILIFNLIIADIQQAVAFMLNAHWLQIDTIEVGTSTCWAQGWFISTGDLASGVFTFGIAVHAFADIIWNYRLGRKGFSLAVFGMWAFVYVCAIIGAASHPDDFYTRAGAWCSINTKYNSERLWLHYFWIMVIEFSTVVMYTLIFFIIKRRIRESFYTESKTAIRAREAAKMVVAYPLVYVFCTLPVVSARIGAMTGTKVGYTYLCIGGAMITSNGWLDVLLYTITRSSLIFHGEMPHENVPIIETFRMPGQSFDTSTSGDSRPYFKQRAAELPGSSVDGQDGPWGFNTTAESIRINERAALSVRMMGHENGLAGDPQSPRFYQRIYQPVERP